MKDKIKIFFRTLFSLGLIGATFSNVYIAYRAFSLSEKKSFVVVTNHVEVVSSSSTNDLPVSSPSNPAIQLTPPSSSTPSPSDGPKQVGEFPYQYFIAHRRIGAYIYGRPFYEGSLTAYGRIKYIFPDRIILDNNDYLSNRFTTSQVREVRNDR